MTIRKGSNIIAGTSQGDLNNKANISLDNLDTAGQAILDAKANDSDVVHKTGDETISSIKTFANDTDPSLIVKNTQWSYLDPQVSSARQYFGIEFRDKNDVRIGKIESTFAEDNRIITTLSASTIVDGDYHYSSLSAHIDKNGNRWSQSDPSDRSNSIVTTINKSKAQNGYFQFGNGLIINWGWFDNLTAGTIVTFSKAFTNTKSYGLCVTPHNGNNTSGYSMHVNTTTATSFKIAKSTSGNVYGFYVAIGY